MILISDWPRRCISVTCPCLSVCCAWWEECHPTHGSSETDVCDTYLSLQMRERERYSKSRNEAWQCSSFPDWVMLSAAPILLLLLAPLTTAALQSKIDVSIYLLSTNRWCVRLAAYLVFVHRCHVFSVCCQRNKYHRCFESFSWRWAWGRMSRALFGRGIRRNVSTRNDDR